MAAVSTSTRGKDKLFRRLKKQLPAQMATEMQKAANQTADEMVVKARRFAPKDTHDLEKSIVWTAGGQMTPPYSQPGGARMVPEGAAMVTAGNSAVRYAHLVEYGTAPHPQGGTGEGTQHPGNAPQPFFWPAYRLVRRKGKTRFSKALKKAVEQTR